MKNITQNVTVKHNFLTLIFHGNSKKIKLKLPSECSVED